MKAMKNFALFLIVAGVFYAAACAGDDQSEKFKILTGTTWRTDSLLVNGVDAGGPAGLLGALNGDARFNEDGTGTFGTYKGTWRFATNETQLIILTDSLPLPLTTNIVELTTASLKLKTSYPNPLIPGTTMAIRMTFKPK
jgi:hypothetical protein